MTPGDHRTPLTVSENTLRCYWPTVRAGRRRRVPAIPHL